MAIATSDIVSKFLKAMRQRPDTTWEVIVDLRITGGIPPPVEGFIMYSPNGGSGYLLSNDGGKLKYNI